ncbi:MAG: HTH domain-containing protein, partial [Culicoidibacterales bacterium]
MNRKQKILTLLAVENDWLTATQLAQVLQVSTRTIRLDIKQLR